MNSVRSLTKFGISCAIVMAMLCSIGPAVARAQSVRGFGETPGAATLLPNVISVDAWLDDDGVAQGSINWVGDAAFIPGDPLFFGLGGPALPWHIDVTDIAFDGNTAYVAGVIVHSVFPSDIGTPVFLSFTDNSGTGQPDEINGEPIVAGNITLND